MVHIFISLKRPGTKCVNFTTTCFVSAVAEDHVLSV